MINLEPLQVGVMFWTGGPLGVDAPPEQIAGSVKSLGVACGQLGVDGEADLSNANAARWKKALDDAGITVVTCFLNFVGESYASIPTCAETVGFVPAGPRAERVERTLAASDFTRELGVPGLAAHVGCLPHDRSDPEYVAVRDLVQRICDRCAKNGQYFALETGQEPASNLLDFMADVDRQNLKINFDPANMILYGSGEPLEALEEVKEHVVTVHAKDAAWPDKEGEWGSETPLGQGDVGMDRFVAKLKEVGYTGPLIIEREILGEEQRKDILKAIALLERLRA